MDGPQEAEERKEGDLIFAIQYVQDGTYSSSLSKDKKRAIKKCAATDKEEVFLNPGAKTVKVISAIEEQKRVLIASHSDSTSGHFGVTKTYKRIAERFYWKGMVIDVRKFIYNFMMITCMHAVLILLR